MRFAADCFRQQKMAKRNHIDITITKLGFFIICLLLLFLPTAHVLKHSSEMLSFQRCSEAARKCLRAQGFSKADVDRLQKCALLCGKNVEARFQSRVLWLLNTNQSKKQVVEDMTACSPSLRRMGWQGDPRMDGDQLAKASPNCLAAFCSPEQNLEPTVHMFLGLGLSQTKVAKLIVCSPEILESSAQEKIKRLQWFLEFGLKKQQVGQIFARNPQILSCGAKPLHDSVESLLDFGFTQHQVAKLICFSPRILGFGLEEHFKPRVDWLLELGLSEAEVVKAIASYPQLLERSVEQSLNAKMQWFSELGLTKTQVVRVVTVLPQIWCCSIEENLKPKVQWFRDLGMSLSQVTKMLIKSPKLLSYSIELNLDPKVEWFLRVGLSRIQVAKVIAANPSILGSSIEENLSLKVQWLLHLGLTKDQVVKVIVCFPSLFKLSVAKNLQPKRVLLQKVFGTDGTAEELSKMPPLLGYSYQRMSSRLKVLVARNETQKLRTAIVLSEDRFHARYLRKGAKQHKTRN